jgi:hypothetical protein
MSQGDLALIEPHLSQLQLPLRKELERPDKVIGKIYFVDHGIASVVAISDRQTQVEVGLIGCEGVSGLAVILDCDRSPHHTCMQVAGRGFCMSASDLRAAMEQSPTLRSLLLRYAQAFGIQTTHATLCPNQILVNCLPHTACPSGCFNQIGGTRACRLYLRADRARDTSHTACDLPIFARCKLISIRSNTINRLGGETAAIAKAPTRAITLKLRDKPGTPKLFWCACLPICRCSVLLRRNEHYIVAFPRT